MRLLITICLHVRYVWRNSIDAQHMIHAQNDGGCLNSLWGKNPFHFVVYMEMKKEAMRDTVLLERQFGSELMVNISPKRSFKFTITQHSNLHFEITKQQSRMTGLERLCFRFENKPLNVHSGYITLVIRHGLCEMLETISNWNSLKEKLLKMYPNSYSNKILL